MEANDYLKRTHCILGWKKETGLVSWLLTLDHKRIGVMYLISTMAAFLLGGVLALGVRIELWSPERVMLSPDWYNRLFTLHGAVMNVRSTFARSSSSATMGSVSQSIPIPPR